MASEGNSIVSLGSALLMSRSIGGHPSALVSNCYLWSQFGENNCLEAIFCTFFFFFIFGYHTAYGVPRPAIRSEVQLQPKPQLQQCEILNPLCWAGDWTWVLELPRCCWFLCDGNSWKPHFKYKKESSFKSQERSRHSLYKEITCIIELIALLSFFFWLARGSFLIFQPLHLVVVCIRGFQRQIGAPQHEKYLITLLKIDSQPSPTSQMVRVYTQVWELKL